MAQLGEVLTTTVRLTGHENTPPPRTAITTSPSIIITPANASVTTIIEIFITIFTIDQQAVARFQHASALGPTGVLTPPTTEARVSQVTQHHAKLLGSHVPSSQTFENLVLRGIGFRSSGKAL